MGDRTIDLANVVVIKDVAWRDERPQCKHVIASWNAGRDVRTRCQAYGMRRGQPQAGYCPMNGGVCAMEDPFWRFLPGWDEYAEWCAQGHGYISSEVWPGFRAGMLGAFVVDGDCMTPTYEDGDVVIARMGTADFYDGAACIVSWRDHGFPIKGWCLKRVTRIGDDMFFITVDNPAFVPSLLSTEVVHIVAVVLDGVKPEQVLDQLAVSHVFDGEGRIVPALLAVALLSEG